MTKVQIELPDATAEAAQAAGLLTSEALDRLLSSALRRRQAGDMLLSIADEVAAAGVPPMSEVEIRAEVKAVLLRRRPCRSPFAETRTTTRCWPAPWRRGLT